MKYSYLSIDKLILICIASVLQKNDRCTFGALVAECFEKYPKTFCLGGYPKWPDSLKLDRPIRELRQRGYITGNSTTYFRLQPKGYHYLGRLGNASIGDVDYYSTRNPDLKILEELETGEEFGLYKKLGEKYNPNLMNLYASLRFTLETPKVKIVNFLDYLSSEALKSRKKEVSEFIKFYKEYILHK